MMVPKIIQGSTSAVPKLIRNPTRMHVLGVLYKLRLKYLFYCKLRQKKKSGKI